MKKSESFLHSLGSALLWKGLERGSGLIKQLLIATTIGLSAQLDVFYMMIGILALVVFSWANLADVVGVPKMAQIHQDGEQVKFSQLSSGLFTLSILISVVLGISWWLGHNWLGTFAPGFKDERKEILSQAVLWVVPAVFLILPMRQLGAIFRATRQFSVFYRAEFLISLTVTISVLVVRNNPSVLFWSFSAGIAVASLYMLAKALPHFKLVGNPFSPVVLETLWVGPSLLSLHFITSSYAVVDRMFISFLSTGSVSALAYGWILVVSGTSLLNFGGSFITIFSAAGQEEGRQQQVLTDMLHLCLVTGIPMSIGFLAFGKPLIIFVLEHGVFKTTDTLMTTYGVWGFAPICTPLFMLMPLEQIYQVRGRIWPLVRRSLWGLLINSFLCAMAIFVFRSGIMGVSLATSFSHWVMIVSALLALPTLGLYVHWKQLMCQGFLVLALSCIFGSLGMVLNWRFTDIHWLVVPSAIGYIIAVYTSLACVPGKSGQLIRITGKRILSATFKRFKIA